MKKDQQKVGECIKRGKASQYAETRQKERTQDRCDGGIQGIVGIGSRSQAGVKDKRAVVR